MDEVDDELEFTFSPADRDEPANTIVRAVAWVKAVDTTELDPLQGALDIEALTEIVACEPAGLEVTFSYEGYDVTVTPSRVRVEPD